MATSTITTQTIPQVVFDKMPLIVSSTIVFLAVYVLKYLLTPDPLANIPVIRVELNGDKSRRDAYKFQARAIYVDGYKKVILHHFGGIDAHS